MKAEKVLVSACLVGVHCRFDGTSSEDHLLLPRLREKSIIPVCPEQLGGLSTPRIPAHIDAGDGHDVIHGQARVIRRDGVDVTEYFLQGAREVLALAELFHVREAYFKAKSPACGAGNIKCGKRSVAGDGVCAALLKENGIKVFEI